MIIKDSDEVIKEKPSLEGTKGCTVRWLIAKKDGANNYAMRLFELQPSGVIPLHAHEDTEHEIFIVEGEGILYNGTNEINVKKGNAIFIKAGDEHSFKNNSNVPLKFICVIPII
jgi:quercetin dioxygenase-like cupin family protein